MEEVEIDDSEPICDELARHYVNWVRPRVPKIGADHPWMPLIIRPKIARASKESLT